MASFPKSPQELNRFITSNCEDDTLSLNRRTPNPTLVLLCCFVRMAAWMDYCKHRSGCAPTNLC